MIKLKDILLEIIETQYLNERAIGELLRFWKIKDYDKFRESLISKLNVLSDKMENPDYKKSIGDADTKFLNRSNVSSLQRDNPIKIIYDIIYKIVNDYVEDTSTRSSIIKNIDFSKYKGLDNVPLEVISNLDEFMSSLDNIVDTKRVSKEKELEEESNKVIEFSKTLKDSLFSKKESFDTDTTSSINIGEDIIKELFKVFKDSKIITVNDNTLIYKFLESIKNFLDNSYRYNISDTDTPDKQYVEVNKVKLYKSYVEKLVNSKKLDKHISDFIFSTTSPSLLSILINIKDIILNSREFVITVTEGNYNPVSNLARLIGIQNVTTDDPEMKKYSNSKTLINFYTLNDPFNRYTIDDLVSGKINKHINNPLVKYNANIITNRKNASAIKATGDTLFNAIMKLSPNPGVLYHGSQINISGNKLLSGQRAYEQMGVTPGSPVDAVYCSTNLSEAYGYSGMTYWANTYRGEFEKAGKNHEKAESSKQVIKNNLDLKTDLIGKLNIYKVTFNTTWAKTALNSNKYVNKYDIDNKQLEGGWFSPYDRADNIKNKKMIYKFALTSPSSVGQAFLFYDMGDFEFNHKAELLISAKNLRTCYELNKIIGDQHVNSRDEAAIIEIDKKYNN